MAKNNILNFYLILFRRKWSVERWIEETGFSNKESVLSWMKAHENEYDFCDRFNAGLENYFANKATVTEMPVVQEEIVSPVEEVAIEESTEINETVNTESSETAEESTTTTTTTTRKTRKKVQEGE